MADEWAISPPSTERLFCPRCGRGLTASHTACPHCGAPIGPAPLGEAREGGPAPPTGLAQLGYIALVVMGGLILLAGAGYIVLVVVLGGAVFDTSLAIAAIAIGASIALLSLRAFDTRNWRTFSIAPDGVWLGAMAAIWMLGLVLVRALPDLQRWVLPPLVVAGAWSSSGFVLSTALRGLRSPAGRQPFSGHFPPRHRVHLSTLVGSSLSTVAALLLEGVALVGMMTVMLLTTRVLGDQDTLDLLAGIADDPQTLERLEELITQSPVALAGLGCILVFVAPALEELAKAVPLYLFARQRTLLTERTAILIGVAGGVGFAFAENVGYLSAFADEWWLIFWFRAAAAVMHGVASGYVGRSWYHGLKNGQWGGMLLDLCRGWGIHAFWNALALVMGWFAYKEATAAVLFCIGFGVVPLAILFAVLARWGIWVNAE